MNRTLMIWLPVLAFALSAAVSWRTRPEDTSDTGDVNPISRGPRQRTMHTLDSRAWPVALQTMESRMLARDPAPPRKEFDAAGMEEMLVRHRGSACFPGIGGSDISYAMGWAEESPEEMFSWLVKQTGERSFYAYLLFERWAAVDVEMALTAALRIPDSKLRAQALISSLEVLSKKDPGRSRELLMKNLGLFSPDEDRPVFNGSGDGDKSFHRLVSSLPPSAERTHLLASLLHFTSDSRVSADYWKELPESERRDLVAAGFSPHNLHVESFEGVEELMREQAVSTGDPKAVRAFIDSHGDAWAERDLVGALNWVQTHMKGEQRAECRERFFRVGINVNFDETIRVWKTLPDGYVKSGLAKEMLRMIRDDNVRKSEAEAVLKAVSEKGHGPEPREDG